MYASVIISRLYYSTFPFFFSCRPSIPFTLYSRDSTSSAAILHYVQAISSICKVTTRHALVTGINLALEI